MKKKILTVTLSLLLLCGAAACNGDPAPKTAPEQQQTTSDSCPDGNCPKQNDDCPDGNCPDENDCPDGNCPKQNDDCPDGNCPDENDCPDGNCPDEKEKRPPVRGVRPRKRAGRLLPPGFPVRPVQPMPEPTL